MERSLTRAEQDLLRETETARIADLDEDALLDLHARIRRARTKYVTLYRREATARVAPAGGRGKARPQNSRNAAKAEVFEAALARVSRRVAQEARRSSAELKAARLAAARGATTPPAPARRPSSATGSAGRGRTHAKTTGGKKRDASTRAKGARRQAARDGRGS
jgi:hypothetical protein